VCIMMHKSYIRQPGGEDLACSCSCACFLAETRRAVETRALLGLKTASGREIRGTRVTTAGDSCTSSPKKGGDPDARSRTATLFVRFPLSPRGTDYIFILGMSQEPACSLGVV